MEVKIQKMKGNKLGLGGNVEQGSRLDLMGKAILQVLTFLFSQLAPRFLQDFSSALSSPTQNPECAALCTLHICLFRFISKVLSHQRRSILCS